MRGRPHLGCVAVSQERPIDKTRRARGGTSQDIGNDALDIDNLTINETKDHCYVVRTNTR
jgi:hypothetical protein